jgi:hypothetical protein
MANKSGKTADTPDRSSYEALVEETRRLFERPMNTATLNRKPGSPELLAELYCSHKGECYEVLGVVVLTPQGDTVGHATSARGLARLANRVDLPQVRIMRVGRRVDGGVAYCGNF